MSPPFVAVKNLETYQHYKHRNPPWVKLHYSVLDDPAFLALDEVQQCRYIKLIMLASRQMNCISTDPQYLGKVLRTGEHVDVTPLIDAGFLIASRKRQSNKMLAPPHENRSQSRVEKSRVETEKSNTNTFGGGLNGDSNPTPPLDWNDLEDIRLHLETTHAPDALHDPAWWRRIDQWLKAGDGGYTVSYLDELSAYLAWNESQPKQQQHKDLKRGLRRWLAKSLKWSQDHGQTQKFKAQYSTRR